MKYQKLGHGSLIFFLFLSTISLKAQNDSLALVEINGKTFLSLIPESAPNEMTWGEYGSAIESYYGITAYSNGARKKGRKYQCTELVHRFVSDVYGIPTRINLGLGHGKDLARNIALKYQSNVGTTDTLAGYTVRLENFENERSAYPPVVGSIVSMHFSSKKTGYGHVGIIRTLKEQEDGTIEAILFDQHGFIHKNEGIPIQSDTIFFQKNQKGNWSGQVLSWKYNTKYPVVSWTNPVVCPNETLVLD